MEFEASLQYLLMAAQFSQDSMYLRLVRADQDGVRGQPPVSSHGCSVLTGHIQSSRCSQAVLGAC